MSGLIKVDDIQSNTENEKIKLHSGLQDPSGNTIMDLVSVGSVFSKFGSEWSYEPSVMFQYRDLTKESAIDFNGKVYKQMDFGKVWGGLSYRQSLDGAEFLTSSNALIGSFPKILNSCLIFINTSGLCI